MARKHGITTNTYKYFAIDSGAVYKNWRESGETLLGATRGGSSFMVEQEIREMPVDGAHGVVVGGKRIVRVIPKITANFIELNTTNLLLMLPGATSANYGSPQTHYALTRSADIASSDYVTNIAIVGQLSGNSSVFIECVISNAIAESNLEMSWQDAEESVLAVTFAGHFQPSDLNTEPWTIRFPTVS